MLERIFGKGTKRIPPNASFTITQNGTAKLQEFDGNPSQAVLCALETRGSSCNIDEICAASGLSRAQVEKEIPILARGGFIRYNSPNQQIEDIG